MWTVQESVSRLLLDDKALKNPVTHVSHVGCVVALPIFAVYLPGVHFVWAMQTPSTAPLLDPGTTKNPGGHISHVVAFPIVRAYFPGGHEMLVVGVVPVATMSSAAKT